MSVDHKNSRIITIMRSGTFLSRAQGAEVDDMFRESKASIGSYFESCSSIRIGSGLSFKEEELLLPRLLDVPATDRDFRKKVSEYYENIDTVVPYEIGIKLETGLQVNNEEPLSEKNVPINVAEYIKYRHAIKHPEVALTKEIAEGNRLKNYYIFDPSQINSRNKKHTEERDAALTIYLQIKEDINKVDMMLTLMGIDPREFSGKNADELKVEALRHQAENKAVKFVEIYQEDELEIRYWIETMVAMKIIRVVGARYMVTETKQILGNTLEETIYYFKDDINSDTVIVLKSLMQEAKNAPIKKTVRKTVLNQPK